jgi:hypothetical protein
MLILEFTLNIHFGNAKTCVCIYLSTYLYGQYVHIIYDVTFDRQKKGWKQVETYGETVPTIPPNDKI